jgi:hypothetical protein
VASDNLPAVMSMAANPARFAEDAGNLHNLAKALAGSTLVPKAFQGRPDDITAAWLLGMELDLPPMTTLLNVHVIEGRASLSANAMRGIAMSKGAVFEVLSASDTRVQMRAKGPGQTTWTPVDWPIERAQKMGLAGKSNWIKMPQSMLIARATSELCRLVASNVLMGMPYSSEELQDAVDQEPAEQPATTTRRRAKPVMAMPEPPLEEEVAGYRPVETYNAPILDEPAKEIGPPPDDDNISVSKEKISPTTRAAIMAGFNELAIKDRNERLAKVSGIVGREIFSVNMLFEYEGRLVVRKLMEVRGAYTTEELADHREQEEWPEPTEVPS